MRCSSSDRDRRHAYVHLQGGWFGSARGRGAPLNRNVWENGGSRAAIGEVDGRFVQTTPALDISTNVEAVLGPAKLLMDSHQAFALLEKLNAPARLRRHVELVLEAGQEILALLESANVPVNAEFVRAGIVLHDAGKIRHANELDEKGKRHEPEGEKMLLEHGVPPALARVCVSHGSWDADNLSFEELLIALSDKLWKGVRKPALEERVIAHAAKLVGADRWDLFTKFDSLFESISDQGGERLERSRR